MPEIEELLRTTPIFSRLSPEDRRKIAGVATVKHFSRGDTIFEQDTPSNALYAIASGRVELLDHPRLLKQLGSLERRKGRQGKDSVDAPPGHHEDIANAACGALTLAVLARQRDPAFTRMVLTLGADDPRVSRGRLSADSDRCPRP